MEDTTNRNIFIFSAVFIILILSLSLPLSCNKSKEPFWSNYGYFLKYCPSCHTLNRGQCNTCTNCVYAITPDGKGKCVPGDTKGAYYSPSLYYEYGDAYTYYPYSHSFPIVKQLSWYPYKTYPRRSRYNIRRPWWY